MQAVLKADIEGMEEGLRAWESRAVPLSERINALLAAEAERRAERDELLAEWPTLEGREKGAALRRLFTTVKLYWERTWHPAAAKPTRIRKTARPGRWSYSLKKDTIEWTLAAADFNSESSC